MDRIDVPLDDFYYTGRHATQGVRAMPKEIVHVPGYSEALAKSKIPLSAAVKANGFVFISGTPPLDVATGKVIQGDIVAQTEAVMENLKTILAAAGSSFEKVVKVNIFIANSAYYDLVNEVYGRYFPADPPARTFATVGSWPWPFDIEIECTALAE